jgi:hypothetical protein
MVRYALKSTKRTFPVPFFSTPTKTYEAHSRFRLDSQAKSHFVHFARTHEPALWWVDRRSLPTMKMTGFGASFGATRLDVTENEDQKLLF